MKDEHSKWISKVQCDLILAVHRAQCAAQPPDRLRHGIPVDSKAHFEEKKKGKRKKPRDPSHKPNRLYPTNAKRG